MGDRNVRLEIEAREAGMWDPRQKAGRLGCGTRDRRMGDRGVGPEIEGGETGVWDPR